MNFKKLQALTQIIGTITLVLLALYGLTGLLNDSASWGAQLMAKAMGRTQNAPLLQWGDSTVPLIINHQGYAKDDEGKPLTGYYTMTLRIYDDVIATTPLWEEEHKKVTVREGYFNLLLGNNEPLTNTLFIHPDRFIGLTVHPSDEMVPRQRFASVPYAMHSYHATKADHALEADHAIEAKHALEAEQADRAYGLNAPDGDPQDALVVDDDGEVGIGTTSPEADLHIVGNLRVDGEIINTAVRVASGQDVTGPNSNTNQAVIDLAEHSFDPDGLDPHIIVSEHNYNASGADWDTMDASYCGFDKLSKLQFKVTCWASPNNTGGYVQSTFDWLAIQVAPGLSQ